MFGPNYDWKAVTRAEWASKCDKLGRALSDIDTRNDFKYERDQAFMKDVGIVVKYIEAACEVFARDRAIHPGYAVEKLGCAATILNEVVKYFEDREEDEKNED